MSETIKYEDFSKIDLRTAKILSAEKVEGSEKLVKLQIDVGELGQRQLVAGIGKAYEPEALVGQEVEVRNAPEGAHGKSHSNFHFLVGKQIIIVSNLEPRKLMGLESNGMLLAASGENGPVLLCPESEVGPGTSIK